MYKLKRFTALLLLLVLALGLCSCAEDGVWGLYTTEKDADGNYKSIECAYSKVFYTSDALAAQAQSDEEENSALFEGWYTLDGDTLTCIFSISEGEETVKAVYTFLYDKDADSLTLTSHTEDGVDVPVPENEIYTKETE